MNETGYWQRTLVRRVSRRGALRALAFSGAGLATAALIGCGSKQQTSSSSRSGATAAGQPKPGGEFRQPTTADPFELDSTIAGQGGPNEQFEELAYEPLLGFDYSGDAYNTALVPKLAEKWETPDAQNFTFQLRKGVKFANLAPVNGREVTSADWKFTFEYNSRLGQFAKLPQAFYGYLLFGIERVDTPDDYTLVLRFKKPFAPLLNYAASDHFGVLPHEIYDQYGKFSDTIVGTGAFQLDPASSQKGTHWVFKKNPTYWDAGKPYLDQITKLVITDNQTAFSAFQVGQLDTLFGGVALSGQDGRVLQTANPTAVITPQVALAPIHLYTNVARPPLDNTQLRRALSLAMDRNEFIQTFTNGQGLLAVPGAFPDTFTQEELKKMTYMKYDPQQAKQLLSAAGFPNGVDLEFLVNQAYGQTYATEAQLLQSQWAKAGIRLKLTVIADYNDYNHRTRGGSGNTQDYQLTMRGKAVDTDVDSYLYQVYDPNGGVEGGVAHYDPKLTPLVEAQRTEADPAKRKELVREACMYIEDQCWGMAIFRDVSYDVTHANVKGYHILWGGKDSDWAKYTWFDKST
jgi:peptide/nickel transport system substrate-binding protein